MWRGDEKMRREERRVISQAQKILYVNVQYFNLDFVHRKPYGLIEYTSSPSKL